MTTHDDRLAIEKAEPKSSAAVPDEDELRTKRAYREQTDNDKEAKATDDDGVDEASEESFPASDPPSYSKGLPKTE
jgi:hypothetical protein